MSKYITYPRGGQPSIIENTWQVIRDSETAPDQLPKGAVMVPYKYFVKHQLALTKYSKSDDFGIYFQVDDDVMEDQDFIRENISTWSIIGIDFPIFRDGRGFSTAAILREQFAWKKGLCSLGDVLIDQLVQMARVGFDAFILRDDQNLETALQQLNRFPVKMQNDWRSIRTIRLGRV